MSYRDGNQATKTNFAAINDSLVLDVATSEAARVEISGVYAFTLLFESSINGTDWFAVLGTQSNSATTSVSHATANATQAYEIPCKAASKVRVRCSAFTSAGAHRVALASS